MRRLLLAPVLAAALLIPVPARADVVRQSANGVEVRQAPSLDSTVKSYGYRRQLVDISNCYLLGEPVGGDGQWGLQTNLSTGIQGFVHDYYLGGRCAG